MTTTDINTAELTDEKRAWLDGLRAMADWFEQHPQYLDGIGETIHIYVREGDDAKERMADAARALGTATKEVSEKYFHLERGFGPHSVRLFTARGAVCERVVVGVEEVEIEEPDPDAVAALPKVKRTETREVVEWVCPESILRSAS